MVTLADAPAFTHDPQVGEALRRGYTLPATWYTRDGVYALEQERIFRRCWQYAGYAEQLATPGDFVTCQLGPVPIVVARDMAGALRAFVNV